MPYEQYLNDIPNRPRTHFKYVTAETAKIILVNRKLRWSSPLIFDDTYDVKRDFDFGFDIKEIKKPFVNEIKNLLSSKTVLDLSGDPDFSWLIKKLRKSDCTDVRDAILKELPQLIDEGIQVANNSYKEIQKIWADFIPRFRIICFCPANNNLQMWENYGDSNQGAVFEFQCVDDLGFWQISQPVIYQDSPPLLATKEQWIQYATGQIRLEIDKPEFYNPYILTKKTCWAYQEEWRVIDFSRDGETGLFTDSSFLPQELRAVYFGLNMPEESVREMITLLNHTDFAHVQIFKGKNLEIEGSLFFERIER